MKKLSIILAAAAAAMLAFACKKAEQTVAPEKQEIEENTPAVTVNPDGTKTITVTIARPVTEAQWADGEGFTWDASEGTQFGLFTDREENVRSTSTAIDGKDIKVTATVSGSATKMVLYYPYENAYPHDEGASTTTPNTWFQLLGMAEQTQAAAGSFEFDDDGYGNIALVSSAVVDLTASSSPFTVSMTPIVSVVRFIPYSSTGLSASVKSITLTADDATQHLNGQEKASFNFSTGEIGTIFSAAGSLSNKVTLTTPFSLSGITSASASKGIYMTTQPTVITGYTITVKMDDASEYKFSTASGLTLAAGQIKNIPLDLDNAMPIFSVDKTSHSVLATATSATINVTAFKAPWTAEVRSGTASISPSSGSTSGSITVSFAKNVSTTIENVYVIRVSTTAATSPDYYDITITQAVAGASGPTFKFTCTWSAYADNATFGFGLGSTGAGRYATLSSVAYANGSEADLSNPDVVEAVIAEATANLDPSGDGVAGNGAPYIADAIRFIRSSDIAPDNTSKEIALGIKTPDSGTAFSKLILYSSNGSELTPTYTWYVWCP